MDKESIVSFKEKLDAEYEWPAMYMFKFIVPKGKEADIKEIFLAHEVSEKKSSKGNYISLTSEIMAESSDAVIDIYIKAHKVEGVIAL